ncbi:hypothetical protein ACFQFQ_01450 [Sulfitobacter porphyrae]|uniref:Uncharacterized protein n=1 Tax=Sulfitobacter porphyrae TaxID=1246864 RepID=A0ABW2B0Q3_9RHOB
MDRGNIFSGGAFRVTVYATSTLLTVFVLTGIVGYRYLQQAQYEHARNWAQPVIGMFQNLYAEGGDAAVAERVQHMADWQDPASRLLSVYRESGDVIGGAFKLRIAPRAGMSGPSFPRRTAVNPAIIICSRSRSARILLSLAKI